MPSTPVPEWLTLFNLISLLLFVLAVFLGLARMVVRLIMLLSYGQRIPRLLKRDLLLFGAFSLVFGVGGFVARVMGIPLSREPAWILPTTAIALFAIFYWVRVEYSLEDEDSWTEAMGPPEDLPADGDLPDAGDAKR